MNKPVSHYATDVARHRLALQEAQERHQAAQAKVAAIQARIADCRQRQQAVTAARLDGTASPESAAEFAALAADVETLGAMLEAARAEITSTDPAEERHALDLAEQQLRHHQAQDHFTALAIKTAEVEKLLCQAIAATHEAGRKIGHHSLSQSWRPSDALHRAVHYGVTPSKEQ